jgi:hypothetical protein
MDVLSGSAYIAPIVSREVCRTCGWASSDLETDWSYAWITPFILVGSALFIVLGVMFHRDSIPSFRGLRRKARNDMLQQPKVAVSAGDTIIAIIALCLPLVAIVIFQVTQDFEPDFVYADFGGFILSWAFSLLPLIPFLLVFYSTRGNYITRWVIGLILGSGVVIGLIVGGFYLVDRNSLTSGYNERRIGVGLIIAGVLYGGGCILALMSAKATKSVRAGVVANTDKATVHQIS